MVKSRTQMKEVPKTIQRSPQDIGYVGPVESIAKVLCGPLGHDMPWWFINYFQFFRGGFRSVFERVEPVLRTVYQ